MSENRTFCTICQGITLRALTSNTGYLHHASYQALESCSQHCSLCDILLCALKQRDDFNEAVLQKELEQQIYVGACDGGYVGLGVDTNLTHFDLLVGRLRCARLQLYTAADDPAALSGIVIGRQISSRPDSDCNLQLIRQWQRECLTKHRYCSIDGQSEAPISRLPTRVVDVTYKDPRIVESQGESGLYVALSHCWGKSKIPVTDTPNLPERKKGIQFQSLPKTFQDAIVVTRRLGYQYLWIDSLCIVQDSHRDWEREASLMGAYYGQAHLTLSATSADGDHVGFLNPRTPRVLAPVKLTLALPNSEIGRVFIALESSNAVAGAFYRNVEQSPTNKRAWILQERALSRRILHFGKEQVFWECGSFALSEDGSSHSQSLGGLHRGFGANLWLMDGQDGWPTSDIGRARRLVQFEWQKLIREYTKRSLSKPSDKFPAISGLARQIPAMFETNYCAGLWESGVRHDLDWVVSGPSEPLDMYRAPSWSWAAVDSPVIFTDERSLKKKTAIFEVESIDVDLLGEDQYGQVKSASLMLHGRLLSLNCTRRAFKFSNRDDDGTDDPLEEPARGIQRPELEITDTAGRVVGWFAPDRNLPAPEVPPCLILYHCRDKEDEEHYSVIFLEPVDLGKKPQIFQRVGMGNIWDIDIEEGQKQSLVLV